MAEVADIDDIQNTITQSFRVEWKYNVLQNTGAYLPTTGYYIPEALLTVFMFN